MLITSRNRRIRGDEGAVLASAVIAHTPLLLAWDREPRSITARFPQALSCYVEELGLALAVLASGESGYFELILQEELHTSCKMQQSATACNIYDCRSVLKGLTP